MFFLPMVFFMNGLTVFLTSCPYLEAFILPSNSTMGPIPVPRETTPNDDRVATHLYRGPGALDGVYLPHYAPHIDSAAAVDSDKLGKMLSGHQVHQAHGKTTHFSNPQRKNVNVVWSCVWSSMLSGHQVHQAHGTNGLQLCHSL